MASVSRRGAPLLVGFLLLLASCTTARIPFVEAPDVEGPVDFTAIERMTRIYRIMRYESDGKIKAAVAPSYDELAIVDLPGTKNRYMIGTLHSLKRQEIWIRGTANVRNALADVDYTLHHNDTLDIDLHEGFEKLTLALYTDILPRLHPDYQLVIFGHSLGGAEAVILSLLLWKDHFNVVQVYASGAPRATTLSGKEKFAFLPILRIVNPGDPVPFLPPRGMGSRTDPFTHLGRAVLLLDGPYYCLLNEDQGDTVLNAAYWPGVSAEGLKRQLARHLTPGYLKRLTPKLAGAVQVPFADKDLYLPSEAEPDAPLRASPR
jgi:hypothetical protein